MDAPRESTEVRDTVRTTVRALLEDTPAFAEASAEERKTLANKLVSVALMAARLAETDETLTREIGERAADKATRTPIAHAQTASDQLGMAAVRSAGATVQNLKDSIGFPEFVQSLITGTFQAILQSSTAQIGSLGEMLDNVAATQDEFESTVQDGEVRSWAVRRFPFLTLSEGQVVMRDQEANIFDYQGQLAAGLSASPDEVAGVDGSDLESTLLPLVRRKIARDKQGILATLIQMGLQRIVVDEGQLEASMDLRVDAQSASQETQQALDSLGVTAGAAANASFGPWGASAYASTSIGRVRSDVQQTSEQIAARAGLRSRVQLAFRTEQVPLDRMASERARVRINQNARVPDVAERSILEPLQPLPPPRLAAPQAPPPPGAVQAPSQPRPAGPPGPQAPNPQAPNPQAPNPQAPRPPGPNPQAPNPQAPNPQAPNPQAPRPPAPNPQAPNPQAPNPQAPNPQAPQPQAPQPQAPQPHPPQPQAPQPHPPQQQVAQHNQQPQQQSVPIPAAPPPPALPTIA